MNMHNIRYPFFQSFQRLLFQHKMIIIRQKAYGRPAGLRHQFFPFLQVLYNIAFLAVEGFNRNMDPRRSRIGINHPEGIGNLSERPVIRKAFRHIFRTAAAEYNDPASQLNRSVYCSFYIFLYFCGIYRFPCQPHRCREKIIAAFTGKAGFFRLLRQF